jgi:hypothetical protein
VEGAGFLGNVPCKASCCHRAEKQDPRGRLAARKGGTLLSESKYRGEGKAGGRCGFLGYVPLPRLTIMHSGDF